VFYHNLIDQRWYGCRKIKKQQRHVMQNPVRHFKLSKLYRYLEAKTNQKIKTDGLHVS